MERVGINLFVVSEVAPLVGWVDFILPPYSSFKIKWVSYVVIPQTKANK